MFVRNANPGATRGRAAAARPARARAHVLLARQPGRLLRRRAGLHRQRRRPGRAAGHVPVAGRSSTTTRTTRIPGDDGAGKNDNIGSDATPMDDNFDPAHPLYREMKRARDGHPPATARCATARSSTASPPAAPGVYAFSRIDRSRRREYVVALNNSESPASRVDPDLRAQAASGRRSTATARPAAQRPRPAPRRHASAPLSAVVYRAKKRIPRSRRGAVALARRARRGPRPPRGRARTSAGDSFYEVTFLAKVGNGRWQDIGTDDNAPYRVFHDVADIAPGTRMQLPRGRARQRATTRARARSRAAPIAPPAIALEAPNDGQRVRGDGRGARARDAGPRRLRRDVPALGRTAARSTDVGHRRLVARLHGVRRHVEPRRRRRRSPTAPCSTYAPGKTVTSDTRTVTIVQAQVTDGGRSTTTGRTATTRRGACTCSATRSPTPCGVGRVGRAAPADGTDAFGARHAIPLKDDTKAVSFIMHRPSGRFDAVDPGARRRPLLRPAGDPEIWLEQGDPAVYFSPPPG